MDTNQKRILNIEKGWSESQKTFAALKLIEQLNKDKLLKGIEFKRILQNYISVVNLADFKIDFWEEDMKESFLASLGLFARRHYEHLKRTNPTTINVMRMNGTLEEYFKEFDRQAEEMYSQLVKQLAKNDGITEELKASDQMEWVRRMDACRNQAIDIVHKELIYV